MELNWSTFILEMINFLVLVWILKRFLYKPVLDVIAARKTGIEKALNDARALHAEAEKLQEQYEGRLASWEQERQQAREAMLQSLQAERADRMAALQISLQQEREKAQVAEARRQADAVRKIEETALEQAARFASRLLKLASGPETQARLVELATVELAQLPAERVEAMRHNYGGTPGEVLVISAWPLTDDQCQQLQQALAGIVGTSIPLRFELNDELLAGIRIIVDAWVLGANLLDELKGFAELAHDEQQTGQSHQQA